LENLALSRGKAPPDRHSKQAMAPVVAEERCLNQPLARLYGLVIASQRGKIPAWAGPLVESVISLH
jgi:hypothetical protein